MSPTTQTPLIQQLKHTNTWICVILFVCLPINAQQYQADSSRRVYDRRAYISSPTIVTSGTSSFVKFPNDDQQPELQQQQPQPFSRLTTSSIVRTVSVAPLNGNYYESHRKRAENANNINNGRKPQTCSNCAHPEIDAVSRRIFVSRICFI